AADVASDLMSVEHDLAVHLSPHFAVKGTLPSRLGTGKKAPFAAAPGGATAAEVILPPPVEDFTSRRSSRRERPPRRPERQQILLRRALALGGGLVLLILIVLGVKGCLDARANRRPSD